MEKSQVFKSKISKKFRLTIPRKIRENLNLSANDEIEWQVDNNRVVIYHSPLNILSLKNKVKIGAGDIDKDIELAKTTLAEEAII